MEEEEEGDYEEKQIDFVGEAEKEAEGEVEVAMAY